MELEKCVKKLLIKNPFYGLFLIGINRYYGDITKTACVCKRGLNIEICINKSFWETLSDEEQEGVLLHEVLHIVFKHIFIEKPDSLKWNIACDLQVNSFIPALQKKPFYYPELYNFENNEGAFWYYDNIKGFENPENPGNPGIWKPDHSTWKDFNNLSENESAIIKNQIDYQLKETADTITKNHGKIPAELDEYIKNLFIIKKQIFNWKSYFRRLVGNSISSDLISTRTKPSKRFPDAPGIKFKKKCNILVGIDTSGSIDSKSLADFFSEIYHLKKSNLNITIAEIDTKINKIYEYTGKCPESVKGGGGTNFEELFNYYNKNKFKYSSLILFTDGYLDIKNLKGKNIIWVITPKGDKKNYPGLTIYMPCK